MATPQGPFPSNQGLFNHIPKLNRKGLNPVMGGQKVPFFYTTVEVVEGQPMQLDTAVATAQSNHSTKMKPCAQGDGAKCIGLSLQMTYADATGQMAQLNGQYFGNDTHQRLNGAPIGLLCDRGWALLENYTGAIASHEQLGVGPSGLLAGVTSSSLSAGDKVPVWAQNDSNGDAAEYESSQGNKTKRPVLIRFDFGFTADQGI